MRKTACITIIALILIILAGLASWGVSLSRKISAHDNFKKCSDQYAFISPEIDCSNINEKIEQFDVLEKKIQTIVNQEEQAGNAQQISVFFRDLNTRQWVGVNENVNFYPASLAKLPLAMMFYKTAEVNKKILDTPLLITEEDTKLNIGQTYQLKEALEPNKTYPVKELLRRILTYSDNVPVNSLMNASNSFRDSVLTDLGIYFPPQEGEENGQWNITAKNYANLFRILYNASYVRPEYSSTILTNLSESTFTNALVSGVPKETKIAHKFGEIFQTDKETGASITILNDCGIVYKQNNPYILCVMTQGKEIAAMEKIIKNISQVVYETNP
jgi:beta-lactamase class A